MTLLDNKKLDKKNFSKTSAAILLSLCGAISSMSVLAMAIDKDEPTLVQRHEITIEAEHGSDMKLFINKNGEIVNLTIPHTALQDKQALNELLVDVPADVREKLLHNLATIGSDAHMNLTKGSHGDALHWVSEGDDERVMIVEMSDDHHGDIEQRVSKEFIVEGGHNMVKVKRHLNTGADGIIKMLGHGKYSAEELNKIQQALDAKR
jgi:hypothetical protein